MVLYFYTYKVLKCVNQSEYYLDVCINTYRYQYTSLNKFWQRWMNNAWTLFRDMTGFIVLAQCYQSRQYIVLFFLLFHCRLWNRSSVCRCFQFFPTFDSFQSIGVHLLHFVHVNDILVCWTALINKIEFDN